MTSDDDKYYAINSLLLYKAIHLSRWKKKTLIFSLTRVKWQEFRKWSTVWTLLYLQPNSQNKHKKEIHLNQYGEFLFDLEKGMAGLIRKCHSKWYCIWIHLQSTGVRSLRNENHCSFSMSSSKKENREFLNRTPNYLWMINGVIISRK